MIPSAELQWCFMRSFRPVGENVNKQETAVELLFDLQASVVLGEVCHQRLQERFVPKLWGGVLRAGGHCAFMRVCASVTA